MCRTGIAGRTAHRDWAPLAAALLQAADVTSGWRRPSRTTKLLTQYFFHAVAARNRRNPILRLFVLSANSPWTSEAANNFLKKFQKHPPSPKISPHSRPPPKKISFPQVPPNRTLAASTGVGGFRLQRLVASAGFAVRKMGWERIKLVPDSQWRFRTAVDSAPVKYRAPPAPATPLRNRKSGKQLQTPKSKLHKQQWTAHRSSA